MSEHELSDYQRQRLAFTDLALSIPDEGATIIVRTNEEGRRVVSYARRHRGDEVAARCRTIAVWRRSDPDKLEGVSGPVILEWAWSAKVAPAVRERVDALLGHPLANIITPDYGRTEREGAQPAPYRGVGDWMEISVRAANVLRRAGVVTALDLAAVSERDLMRVDGCGRGTAREIMDQRRAILTDSRRLVWLADDGLTGPLTRGVGGADTTG